MERDRLIELIKASIEAWETGEIGDCLCDCLFCDEVKGPCKSCPIGKRWGSCATSKRNPFRKRVKSNLPREEADQIVIRAGKRWLKELEKEVGDGT